jgi:hypothetical protein
LFPGIRHAKPVQHTSFRHFHAPGVARVIVTVTTQMQRPVHDQMRQVMGHRPARGSCLTPYDAKRQHDLRRWIFIGQHIGGSVLPAMPSV